MFLFLFFFNFNTLLTNSQSRDRPYKVGGQGPLFKRIRNFKTGTEEH